MSVHKLKAAKIVVERSAGDAIVAIHTPKGDTVYLTLSPEDAREVARWLVACVGPEKGSTGHG